MNIFGVFRSLSGGVDDVILVVHTQLEVQPSQTFRLPMVRRCQISIEA